MKSYLIDFIKTSVKEHSLENPNVECCGIILDVDDCPMVIRCENKSLKPDKHFIIDTDQVRRAKSLGTIVSYYHSHIKGQGFSEVDKWTSERMNVPAIVYHIEFNSFGEYQPIGYEVPLLNRPFLMGVFDCLTLVIDYYQRELNTTVTDMIKHELREKTDWRYFNESNDTMCLKNHFVANGFVEVKGEWRKNDVVLARQKHLNFPSHCLIYLGNGMVMHHPFGRPSRVEVANKEMSEFVVCVMRKN